MTVPGTSIIGYLGMFILADVTLRMNIIYLCWLRCPLSVGPCIALIIIGSVSMVTGKRSDHALQYVHYSLIQGTAARR